MSFEKLIFLGFLWFIFGVLRKGKVNRPTLRKRTPTPSPSPVPVPPVGTDPTQREGLRLETLLGDFRRGLDDVARTKGAKDRPESEARESRTVVDQDEAAAQVEEARIAQAEARRGALTDADHQRFEQQIHQQIRQEPADHTAVRRYTPPQLRDAVVWREILGPPVALRGEGAEAGSRD